MICISLVTQEVKGLDRHSWLFGFPDGLAHDLCLFRDFLFILDRKNGVDPHFIGASGIAIKAGRPTSAL